MAEKKIPMMLLTTWCGPHEGIETVRGRVPCREWLEGERDRIAAQPGRVAQVVERDGKRALIVDDPCVCAAEKSAGMTRRPRATCRCKRCVEFRKANLLGGGMTR